MFGVGFLPYPSVFDKTFSTQFLNGGKQEKMKKRLLSMLMAVLMIASLVPAVALADGTCTHAKDDVTAISVDPDAAKKQPGLDIKVCNKCGDVIMADITPFADANDICAAKHTFKTFELQAATCEKLSIKVAYCTVCGTAAENPVIVSEPTDSHHVYTQFKVVSKPGCTWEGWGYTVCDKCGDPAFVSGVKDALTKLETSKPTAAAIKLVKAQFAATNPGHADYDAFAKVTKDQYDTSSYLGEVYYKWLVAKAAVEPTHSLTVSGQVSVNETTGKVTVDGVANPDAYVATEGGHGKDPYVNYSCTWKYDQTWDAWYWVEVSGHGLGYEGDVKCADCGEIRHGDMLNGLNEEHAAYMQLDQPGYYPYMDNKGVKHDGVTDVWTCTKCDKTFGGEKLPFDVYANHQIGSNGLPTANYVVGDTWVVGAKDPTCTEKGSTGTTYVFTKDGGWQVKTDAKEIPALGHDLKKIESKEATCKETGWTAYGYYVCARGKDCSDWDKNNGYPYHQGKIIVDEDFADCKPIEKVLVEPTCKNRGLIAFTCKNCDKLVEVDDAVYTYVPVVPHTAGDPVNAKEATCTEVGYTGDKVCKWCGIMLEKGKEIPMKEHTVVDVAAVEATCTADGMTAGTKCSVCGTVLSGCEVVKALGHDFKDGKCTRCGEKDPNYVPPVVNPFKDVEKSSPYYDAIIWAADKGVTTGKTADTFGINDGCTRAQIVTFLYRAAGSPAVKADTVNPFTDVSKDSVYYNAILWAVEKGITKGTTETTFDPNAVCTRGQIVTFLFRASGDEKVATGTDFADVAATSYCADAVAWAVANKVANGFADGTFRPEATCTRGQAVTFIFRALAK